MGTSSSPEYPYPGGTPGAEPPDPVAGRPGHFAWSRWVKQFVKNLDANLMAHQDSSNPHPNWAGGGGGGGPIDEAYLLIDELVQGENVILDKTTTPGSVIISTTVSQGPEGPPGTAYLNAQWNFNQNVAPSPANGTIRMNATTYAAVTLLWVSEQDRDGLDRGLGLDQAETGDHIIMQSAQGRVEWLIEGHADSGTYRSFTVSVVTASGNRPSASSVTTMYFTSAGGVAFNQEAADALYYKKADGSELVNIISATGSTPLDPALGNVHKLTLTGATQVVLPTGLAGTEARSLTVMVTPNTFGYTWSANVKWAGTPPIGVLTAGKTDIYSLMTVDGGTNWYGFAAGLGF